uniref:Protein MGARP N-terminal domain-containing protein n=1 Tax=Tetraodon nigroviridis TaxID=99883 RepID=H3D474_TETNG
MFCRRPWRRLVPLTRTVFDPATSNAAPVRRMALGAPGGSFNRAYLLLCGGGLAAALVYAYKTINSDSERYERRLAALSSTAKAAEPAPRPEVAGVAEGAEVTADSLSAPADEAAEPEACGEAAAASEGAAPPAN